MVTYKHDPGCMAGPEGQNHCHAHGCATPPEPAAPCDCEGPVHECRVPEKNPPRLIKAIPLRAPEPAARLCFHCGDPADHVHGAFAYCVHCRPSPTNLGIPEPAAPPRVTPEDWQHLLEVQETAREIGERLAKMRERFGLDAPGPDEAERVAREHLGVTVVTKYTRAAVDDLATLLRAAEARGRERGLAEGIVIGEAHENERVALYVASLLGDGHDVPRRIRQLGRK